MDAPINAPNIGFYCRLKVILLHCIVQPESSGGESEVTDGLVVCERLKKTNADHYDALSTVPVRWIDRGHDNGYSFHNAHLAPVIWLVMSAKPRSRRRRVTRPTCFHHNNSIEFPSVFLDFKYTHEY